MLYKFQVLSLIVLTALIGITGCKKGNDGDTPPAAASVNITIDQPLDQAVIVYNQIMTISGNIAVLSGTIQGYSLTLRKKSDGTVLHTRKNDDPAMGTVLFSDQWKNELHHEEALDLEVLALLDTAGKTISRTITVTAKAPEHVDDPVITITSPEDNDMVSHGETVVITGSITWEQTLHGYDVVIRKKDDGTEIFKAGDHVHDQTIHFAESWVNNLTSHTDLELEIITYTDHDGSFFSKKISLHAHADGGH